MHYVTLALCLAFAGLSTLSPDSSRAPANAAPGRLSSFKLADQFGTNHSVAFPRQRLLLLTIADLQGSKQVHSWTQPTSQLHNPHLDWLGIAHVGPVPKLFRGRILRDLRARYPQPLLIDWSNDFAESLSCIPDQANIFLVHPNGLILHRASGPATSTALLQLHNAINHTLSPHTHLAPAPLDR
jgi:hypothetical protein